MTQSSSSRLTSLVFGLSVTTVGVLFTLDNLDVLRARDYLRYWPVALLAVGVAQIAQARTAARVFAGAIWILVGGAILGKNLHLLRFDIWDYWPLLLVLLGGFTVWQAFSREARTEGAADESTVSAIAVLSGIGRKTNSPEFRGGELTAFMGGCEVDLREAIPADGEATIDVFAMMGGIEIKVPETWTVVNKVFPFMGGVEDTTKQPPRGPGPRLIVRGFAIMGGIGLKN